MDKGPIGGRWGTLARGKMQVILDLNPSFTTDWLDGLAKSANFSGPPLPFYRKGLHGLAPRLVRRASWAESRPRVGCIHGVLNNTQQLWAPKSDLI